MKIHVRLFALARDLAGQDSVHLALPAGGTLEDAQRELFRRFPSLGEIGGHLMFAVDGAYAKSDTRLHDGAEVACIPPVSGG